MKLTPILDSFSAGEISPLMYMRYDSEGYKQGAASMENMFPDSRGAAYSRGGAKYINGIDGYNDARTLAIPVNDVFFYSGIFVAEKLIIGSLLGHNPSVVHSENANFNLGSVGWDVGDDGNDSSTAIFTSGQVKLNTSDNNSRYVYVSQQFTVPATGNYRLIWTQATTSGTTFKIGTTEDGDEIWGSTTSAPNGNELINFTSATVWVTARIDGTNALAGDTTLSYLGVTDETPSNVEFVTPYLEEHLSALQGIQSPSGGAMYVLHESYPPHKLTYDRVTDAFSWGIVTFTSPPAEWTVGSYPSAGDFFEGRLWLGGTVNEPQTFWASKSGVPENFTTGVNDDDALEFTMAKYGRIEWMVGFKNLVIGTQNGEHIVTSAGGYIAPDDIQVQQQSSYGSANVQPVQVGDQIFYVSADRRKLRAIQYEWQKDNWLSKDLTFNSEHITIAGIKHLCWQQNPNNLFHCVLEDGNVATMTYERGHNIYGWCRMTFQGAMLDMAAGFVEGRDFGTAMMRYKENTINFETQSAQNQFHHMDSWVSRVPIAIPDSTEYEVTGLEHLEGFAVQVTVDGATHPDRVVAGGKITLQYGGEEAVVGLKFTVSMKTLPLWMDIGSGNSAAYMKRWNKVYVRMIDSSLPLINGERAPERHPSSPMDLTQPNVTGDVYRVNLGYDRYGQITIEQDLPRSLIVIGIFGEMAQSIL